LEDRVVKDLPLATGFSLLRCPNGAACGSLILELNMKTAGGLVAETRKIQQHNARHPLAPSLPAGNFIQAGWKERLAMKGVGLVVAMVWLAAQPGNAQAQPRPARALAQASAQGFPDRPLRIIVQFPPGGSSDVVARIMAVALSELLGEQVVVDNRGGAAGNIGAEIAARATADGYTLFTCNIATFAISPALYRKLAYDAQVDFAPLGLIGSTPSLLVVHSTLPAATVAEFVSHVQARPGRLNYASAGVGTSPQLAMELFKAKAGIDIVHIPYKGGGPALADLIGGHVQAMFSTVPTVITAIRSGRIRVLGVSSAQRVADLPDVPTIAESGMPGFEVTSWQAMCTPAGVPPAVLARLRSEFAKALTLPDTIKRLADQGMQPSTLTLAEFESFVRAERAKWAKVVKDAGIRPQ
jgi:tripartite-type tricarboxylate transporter receptor subunit TctC